MNKLLILFLFIGLAVSMQLSYHFKVDHNQDDYDEEENGGQEQKQSSDLDLSALAWAEFDKHNELRAKHGCPPLEWNDTLTDIAQKYSETQFYYHKMFHSQQALKGVYGQNLYTRTQYPTLKYPPGLATQRWYAEIQDWSFSKSKQRYSNKQTGHLTQLLWKSTKTVGFGFYKGKYGSGETIYVTANYYPPGNRGNPMIGGGKYKINVPPPLK